jgi:hypothetical protein
MFRIEQLAQAPWQQLVDPGKVYAPHLAVVVESGKVRGRKVQGDQGRVGPVEQTCRKTGMLGEGKPVPDRVGAMRVGECVLAKASQEAKFNANHVAMRLVDRDERRCPAEAESPASRASAVSSAPVCTDTPR